MKSRAPTSASPRRSFRPSFIVLRCHARRGRVKAVGSGDGRRVPLGGRHADPPRRPRRAAAPRPPAAGERLSGARPIRPVVRAGRRRRRPCLAARQPGARGPRGDGAGDPRRRPVPGERVPRSGTGLPSGRDLLPLPPEARPARRRLARPGGRRRSPPLGRAGRDRGPPRQAGRAGPGGVGGAAGRPTIPSNASSADGSPARRPPAPPRRRGPCGGPAPRPGTRRPWRSRSPGPTAARRRRP